MYSHITASFLDFAGASWRGRSALAARVPRSAGPDLRRRLPDARGVLRGRVLHGAADAEGYAAGDPVRRRALTQCRKSQLAPVHENSKVAANPHFASY